MSRDLQQHPVNEILPPGQLFTYGLQHVLAMYAGAVAVPLIVAFAIHMNKQDLAFLINADLFTCGLATLLQTLGVWKMGIRIPVIQGVTFAAVSPMIVIAAAQGMRAVYGAIIVAGILTFFAAPFFCRIIKLFPPVVTGSVITIIGISLLPVSIDWAAGGVGMPGYGSLKNIAMATVVLIPILVINRFFKGFLGNISVLLGLIIGTLIAIPAGMVNFAGVAGAPWVGIDTPFHFGPPIFAAGPIISMILVLLVTMVESTGDFLAIGEIIGLPIGTEDLARGLRADGFATALGGVLNAFPYTAFAQNVGLVNITGVRSRFVVATAGVILVFLGLIPKFAEIVASIPNAVLGGAGIVMFGIVAATGIRTLSRVKYEGTHNALVVAVSIGIGLIPTVSPHFFDKFPAWLQIVLHSGITAGSVAAILMNLFFNILGKQGEIPAECGTEPLGPVL